MKLADSAFGSAMLRTWERLPLWARLALGVVVTTLAILVNVAVDGRSDVEPAPPDEHG